MVSRPPELCLINVAGGPRVQPAGAVEGLAVALVAVEAVEGHVLQVVVAVDRGVPRRHHVVIPVIVDVGIALGSKHQNPVSVSH